MRKRKKYSPKLKAEIVLEVLREEQSLSQIASEYGIHPNQLSKWKNQFLRDAEMVFKDENKPLKKLKEDYEKKVENLYTEVGKLTTQLNWLKKKYGEIDKG